MNDQDLARFELARPAMMGIARRLLGSRADAEDAVQDCFLKWCESDRADITSPVGWLATVCAHRCLDLLRSAQRSRVDYVGESIMDQVDAADPRGDDCHFPASVDRAFSLLLQRLTPKERAAYVLREIFEQSFEMIAAMLQIRRGACEKLVERARHHIARSDVRHAASKDTQQRLLRAFESAIATSSPLQLAILLARDAHTHSRSSKRTAALRILHNLPHDQHGDRRDEIPTNAGPDHRCQRQDRPESQCAA